MDLNFIIFASYCQLHVAPTHPTFFYSLSKFLFYPFWHKNLKKNIFGKISQKLYQIVVCYHNMFSMCILYCSAKKKLMLCPILIIVMQTTSPSSGCDSRIDWNWFPLVSTIIFVFHRRRMTSMALEFLSSRRLIKHRR